MADEIPDLFDNLEKGARNVNSEINRLNQTLEKTRSLASSAFKGAKNVGGRALSFLQPLDIAGSVAGGQGAGRAASRSVTELATYDYAAKATLGWETWGKTMERVADRTVRSSSKIGQALGRLSQVSARASQVAFNPAVVGVSAVISAYYELSASAKKAADEVEKHNKRLKYAFQGMGGSPSGLLQSAGVAATATGMNRAQTIQLMGQAGAAGFGAQDSQRIVRIAHAIAREQGQEIAKVIGGVIQNASIATSGMTGAQSSDYLRRQALARTSISARPTLQQELEKTGRYGILQERAEGLRSEARYDRYGRPILAAVEGAKESLGFLSRGGVPGYFGRIGGERATSATLGIVGTINRGRAISALYDVKDHAGALRRSGNLTRARELRERADFGLREIEIERVSQQVEDEQSRFQKLSAVTQSMQARSEAQNLEKQIGSIDKQLQTGNLTEDQAKVLRRKRASLSIEASKTARDSRKFMENLSLGDKLTLIGGRILGRDPTEQAAQLAARSFKTQAYLGRLQKEEEREERSFLEGAEDQYYKDFNPEKVNDELEQAQKKVVKFATKVHELQVLVARDPENRKLEELLNKIKGKLAGAQAQAGKLKSQQEIFDVPAIVNLQDRLKYQERRQLVGQTRLAIEQTTRLGVLNENDISNLKYAADRISDPEKKVALQQRILKSAETRSKIKEQKFDLKYLDRNVQNEKDSIRLMMDQLSLQGKGIKGSDREIIEQLLQSKDYTDVQNAKKLLNTASQEQNTRFARVQLGIQRAEQIGTRSITGVNLGVAARRGIISEKEAGFLGSQSVTGIQQEQEAINKILQIKEEAFQREIDFTTKYTQARLNIISAHYEKARGLEELQLYGRERQQAPFIQFGQAQFGLGQIGQQVQQTAVGVAEQQLSQARGFRDIGRTRRDLVLGFTGVQKPRAVQFVENMQRLREQEKDMKRRQQQQISSDTMGFRGFADTLESLRGQGVSEQDLKQTSGGRQLLLQMYRENQAGFERAGVGDQARSRIGGLIQQEREFAGRQLKLQLRTRQLTKEEYEKKIGTLQEQLGTVPEGERRQLVQANLAGVYKEAAGAAQERGDVQAYEKYMSKYEKAIEGLPEHLKGIYDDANKITNSLLTTQNDILRAINTALGGADVGKSSVEGKVGGGTAGKAGSGKGVGSAAAGQAHGGGVAETMMGGMGFNVAPRAAYRRGFGSMTGGAAGLGIAPMTAATDTVGVSLKQFVKRMGLPNDVQIGGDAFGRLGGVVRDSNRAYQAKESQRRKELIKKYGYKEGRKKYIEEYKNKISGQDIDIAELYTGTDVFSSDVEAPLEAAANKYSHSWVPEGKIMVPNIPDTGIQTSPDVSSVEIAKSKPEDKMTTAADKFDKAAEKLLKTQIEVRVHGPGTASVKSGSSSYSPEQGQG
jgi:hypothetical protein